MRDIARGAGLKGEKRQRLVEAAIEEFNEYGLENASYNRIIERSGLSKGSVYYYFDNKDALLGTVMEEIGKRLIEAVPERPLPKDPRGFWQTVWDYRRMEFEFFASNVSLGRVLIMSLGNHDLAAGDTEGLSAPLASLIQRQTRLLRRGQEIGAIRGDVGIDVIFQLMRAVDRALCVAFFGREAEDMEKLSGEERTRRSSDYAGLFRDLITRMLLPEDAFVSGAAVGVWRTALACG